MDTDPWEPNQPEEYSLRPQPQWDNYGLWNNQPISFD